MKSSFSAACEIPIHAEKLPACRSSVFGLVPESRLELHQIAPKHVGQYLDELPYAAATKKVHLSALRHFFDELVVRHAVVLNPAASVRGERYQVIEGKTPEISVKQARLLLRGIDTENVVGLRDRSIIGILIYTAARIGAVAKLHREHFYDDGEQYYLRFSEKSGKSREIPMRHDLRGFLGEYLLASGHSEADPGKPLFRTATWTHQAANAECNDSWRYGPYGETPDARCGAARSTVRAFVSCCDSNGSIGTRHIAQRCAAFGWAQ